MLWRQSCDAIAKQLIDVNALLFDVIKHGGQIIQRVKHFLSFRMWSILKYLFPHDTEAQLADDEGVSDNND